MAEFLAPEVLRRCQAGQAVVVRDVFADPLTDGHQYAALHIGSFVSMPLVRNNEWRFLLVVYRSEPYDWRADEIELLRELTARIWTRLERARAEEALLISEQRLRTLLENLPGAAVFIVDHNLRYQEAQGTALLAAGLTSLDLQGRTLTEALPPEQAAHHLPYYLQALAGHSFALEHEAYGHTYVSRGVPLLGADGQPEAVLVVSYDITARKQAEQAQQASEAKYRALFEAIEQGYGIAEVRLATAEHPTDVRWLEVNPAFQRLTQLPAAALSNGQWARALAVDIEEEWYAHYEQVVRTGRPVQFELFVRRLDIWFEVYAFSLQPTQLGALPRIGVLFHNSTVRYQARQQEQLMATLERQEEERRRIAESLHNGLGQLLYATKLQLDLVPPSSEQPALRKASLLLTDAIKQTRTLSHELTPALISDIGLDGALTAICHDLSRPGLRWHCRLELVDASILPMALQQAVYRLAQGLAHNVAKHAQASEATLEVEIIPHWLVLRIEDNGRGFDPATVHEGLGLQTLRSRVTLLGGTMQLKSAPAQGTHISIRFPLH